MKIIIFAGGSGRRLWPISRVKSPKQFEPIIGSRSTLQLSVDRVQGTYGLENIYISTNERYSDLIQQQLPQLAANHIIGEPMRRDLAPAVGLALVHLSFTAGVSPDEPIAILWGDSYVQHVDVFSNLLGNAEKLVQQDTAKIFFVGETPRFANENLGWLGLGETIAHYDDNPCYRFESLTYRPKLELCRQLLASGNHVWNTGYFITTIGYVRGLYQQYQPEMWAALTEIGAAIGTPAYQETLNRVYPTMERISFDDAILVHIPAEHAAVLHGALGWSDPGTLYALKEAIQPDPQINLIKGNVIDNKSRDSLIYNYEPDKLVVAPGLDGMIVVNTEDAILVVHKDQIPLLKEVVDGFEGSDYEAFS